MSDEPKCKSCGTPWSDHPGAIKMCDELTSLRAENERLRNPPMPESVSQARRLEAQDPGVLYRIIQQQGEELERQRETNRRLNRRCQEADAAVADAKRCIEHLADGNPWCGGSLGRALLAHDNTRLRALVERLGGEERAGEIADMLDAQNGPPVRLAEPEARQAGGGR